MTTENTNNNNNVGSGSKEDSTSKEKIQGLEKQIGEAVQVNSSIMEQLKAMQAQQKQMADALGAMTKAKQDAEDALKKKAEEEAAKKKEEESKKKIQGEDNKLNLEALMAELKATVANANKEASATLLEKISKLESDIEANKLKDAKLKEIALQQIEKAQIEAYRKEAAKNTAFPELVTGNTIEEIDASVATLKEREASIAARGKQESYEQLVRLNPALAKTINPGAKPNDGSLEQIDSSYTSQREFVKQQKSKEDFAAEINRLKQDAFSKGIAPKWGVR